MALLTIKFATDVRNLDYEVVELHGELDKSTIALMEKQMTEFLPTFNRKALIFDFSDLTYINSEGIGFVVNIHTKLSRSGKQLVICGMQGNVADIFDVIGMSRLIPTFPDMAQAVTFLKK